MATESTISSTGQSLVEAVVAIGVIALVLVGLVSAITFSMANAQYARNKTLATKYAQEAVEWLRARRDQYGWNDATNGLYTKAAGAPGFTYCLNDLSSPNWHAAGACTPTMFIYNTIFKREANLTQGSDVNTVNITVTVSWPRSSQTATVILNTDLTNWLSGIAGCSGYLDVQSRCWYVGAPDVNCDNICLSHGGCKNSVDWTTSDCALHAQLGLSCLAGCQFDPLPNLSPSYITSTNRCIYGNSVTPSCNSHNMFTRRLCVCNN